LAPARCPLHMSFAWCFVGLKPDSAVDWQWMYATAI
jgi:hypothetical protein